MAWARRVSHHYISNSALVLAHFLLISSHVSILRINLQISKCSVLVKYAHLERRQLTIIQLPDEQVGGRNSCDRQLCGTQGGPLRRRHPNGQQYVMTPTVASVKHEHRRAKARCHLQLRAATDSSCSFLVPPLQSRSPLD